MSNQMSDIIEILESADVGSRELDATIEWGSPLEPCDWDHDVPHYTTSIDAALTLVPDGWVYSLINDFGGLNRVRLFDGLNINIEEDGYTMPLSICIAALAAIAYK